ncbi:MAG: carbohydrate-binding domain-containing protein, partial [Oscillospiraceae bacterium]|nr:carbohydrate-binding domain-containing protein [Oscillospiraceae bacterium]
MKKILKKTALPVLLCTALMLAGCQTKTAGTATSASSTTEAVTDTAAAVSTIDTSALFSDRDLDASYDESTAVTIQLSGDTASCSSDAVTIDGSQITLLDEGTYVFSGTLTNGQIVIDADDTDQVQIVLSGADITSSTSAAIYSLEADKVFVTLAEGTENFLANGGAF